MANQSLALIRDLATVRLSQIGECFRDAVRGLERELGAMGFKGDAKAPLGYGAWAWWDPDSGRVVGDGRPLVDAPQDTILRAVEDNVLDTLMGSALADMTACLPA